MTPLRLSRFALLLALATPLLPQIPQAKVMSLPMDPKVPAKALTADLSKAELLPAGKTLGTFHLNAFVKKDRTVVLRWANTHGEMPVEGVTVWRQKVGDRDWKELNRRDPVGFFRGAQVKERMKRMDPAAKSSLMSLFHSDLQRDPVTKQRMTGRPAGDAKMTLRELTPEKVNAQYRQLRSTGRLAKHDLQLLQAHADADAASADLFGLGYTDDPGKGHFKYKIVVKLAEGGSVEALLAKEVDSTVPTPVPAAINLSAKSGNGSVLLNWEASPSDVVAGYHVYRAETEKGPWKKVTQSPVKLVKLELEDPEAAMRRTAGTNAALEKEMKKASGQALTAGKIAELRVAANEAAPATLSPALSAAIKDGVSAGRLKGGLIAPASLYTDDQRKAGNGDLVNEKPYLYRITTVDIVGGETAVEMAPTVVGTPKDLEPPKVPGRPGLLAHVEALGRLKDAQGLRVKDTKLVALEQAQASKMPLMTQPILPALASGVSVIPPTTKPAPAGPVAYSTMSLTEVKKERLSHLLATSPTKELAEVAAATLLHSNPDGSVPPAKLQWTPSPDADLATYEVYRAAGKGTFQKVASVPTPAWTDTSLEVGQAYRYVVSAIDKLGNESNRSDEGLVEVSDSRLKEKLALKGLQGKPSTAVFVPGTPSRSYLRPEGRIMKAAGPDFLKASSAPLKLPTMAATAPSASYTAPAAMKTAKVGAAPKGLAMTHGSGSTPKAFEAAKADPKSMSIAGSLKAVSVAKLARPNFMFIEPTHPKEIRVLLEWERPLEGMPLEYVIEQAPQKFELKQMPRPTLSVGSGLRMTSTFSTASSTTLNPGVLAVVAAQPTVQASPMLVGKTATTAPKAGGAPLMATVVTTPDMHAMAAKGLVAQSGRGLKAAPEHAQHMAQLLMATGPGDFNRVNEGPVAMERYVITFPAESAQFGGTTFYFRVKAVTKEFGRTVEGAFSEPVEVRLPDVVPPAIPAAGSLALREGGLDQFDVSLDWTEVSAKDLAGYVLERQTFAYTVVDGQAKPGAPMGQPQRVVPDPVSGHAFVEKNAPGGYQRYTVRSADKTGNLSDPSVALDVLIPGEPVPAAPTALSLAGGRLTWKAAPNALGYTVWRSFSGMEEDFEQISPILAATESGFTLPPQGTLHLKVVARSASGMHQTASESILRTP